MLPLFKHLIAIFAYTIDANDFVRCKIIPPVNNSLSRIVLQI